MPASYLKAVVLCAAVLCYALLIEAVSHVVARRFSTLHGGQG